jgi:hypothetical protein
MATSEKSGKPKKVGRPKGTKSKPKTSAKKSGSKKGGNFLGSIGDLVAPTGWGPFATAAALVGIDQADAAFRRKKSTKSSAKKGGMVSHNTSPKKLKKTAPYTLLGVNGNNRLNSPPGPPPIPVDPENEYYGSYHFGVPKQNLPIFNKKQVKVSNIETNSRVIQLMEQNRKTKSKMNQHIKYHDQKKEEKSKLNIDLWINDLKYYISYILPTIKDMNANMKLQWDAYLNEFLKNLDAYLSNITFLENLRDELKKLKKSVDLSKLTGNSDLTKLKHIGKYFRDPFELVTVGYEGKPVVKQTVNLNLNTK